MTVTVPENGLQDDIELVRTADGWAWVDTGSEGPGTRLVEPVEVVEYAVTPREVGGVEHLEIAEIDPDDAGSTPSTERTVCSSHWYDLDDVR